MALSIALSSGQDGISPDPGVAYKGIFTLTPGTSATAGENMGTALAKYFSTIDSIEVGGGSTVAILGYNPNFGFAPGALTSTDANIKLFWLVQDGAAGKLEPDNGTDLSAVGTVQLIIRGKSAV